MFLKDGLSSINVLHVNIRSLRKNWEQLKIDIDSTLITWDIICLTEINIKDSESRLYQLENYDAFCFTREETNRGGGVMLFVKISNSIDIVNVSNILIDSNNAITADLLINEVPLTLLVIYRQPLQHKKKTFVSKLAKVLEKFEFTENLCLIGDINIDILEENHNGADYKLTDKYLNLLASCGLFSKIDSPTREEKYGNRITRSCIDHCFIKSKFHDCLGLCIEKKLADHYYIAAKILTKSTKVEENISETNVLMNDKNIIEKLNNIDWLYLEKHKNDPVYIYNEITKRISQIYTEESKLVTKNTQNNKAKKPWVTNDILQMITEKNLLWKKIKSNTTINKAMFLDYSKLKSEIRKRLNASKNNYFYRLINDTANKTKNMWSHLNKFINKQKDSTNDKELIKNFKFDTEQTLGQKLNLHFANVVPNLRNKFKARKAFSVNKRKLETQKIKCNAQSIVLFESSPNEIMNIIKNMNIKLSTGLDGIQMKHLVKSLENSAICISILINSIISAEIWPDDLKISILRPVYKKGCKSDPGNYRPIALLSNINKIIEKFFYTKIVTFLDRFNIITEKQYGFRQNKSTTDSLKHINEVLAKSLNDGMYAKAVLIDLQKAFDTLDHSILLEKCEKYGLRGKCHNIIKSYLNNRKACTKIKNSNSSFIDVKYGVPQGSVLGPLLFIIYINDITNCISHCDIILYADDTILISLHKDKNIMETNLELDFDNLNNWFLQNDLFINDTKTFSIDFYSPQRKYSTNSLFIHTQDCTEGNRCKETCNVIEQVTECKYLGMHIDSYWKHNFHVKKLINKLRQMLPFFYHIKTVLNNKNKQIVFDAMVTSHLRYGIEVYGFASAYQLERLQKVQNKLVKVLFLKNNQYIPTNLLFKEHNILTVTKLRDYIILLNNYFNHQHKQKDDFKLNFLRDKTVRYKIPLIKNQNGLKCKNHYIPTLFNNLPPQLNNLIPRSPKLNET